MEVAIIILGAFVLLLFIVAVCLGNKYLKVKNRDYEIVEKKELSQSQVTKTSDIDDDLDALEQAIYALESFVVEDKPDKCFAGHHVPFIKAIEKLKSLKQRMQ